MPKAKDSTETKKTRRPTSATSEETQVDEAPLARPLRVDSYYEIEREDGVKVYGQLVDHNEAEGVQTLKMWVGGEASFTQELQKFNFADHNVREIDRVEIQNNS